MKIISWFLAVNLLLVLAALVVKARRRHGGRAKTPATAGTAPDAASGQWTVQNDILGIGTACDLLRDFLESREVPIRDLFDLTAILEEMLSYVLSVEFPEHRAREIRIAASIAKASVTLELRYAGKGCNPLSAPEIDLSKPLEEISLEGLDIHLLKHWTDRLDYRSEGGLCVFTAFKRLTPKHEEHAPSGTAGL
jgi:anti-sigma regulatory factor (Ser/Thr protein kinase)